MQRSHPIVRATERKRRLGRRPGATGDAGDGGDELNTYLFSGYARLLIGRSVVTERDEIEAAIHEFYLGHSKAALLFALHQVFEAVDQSAPLGKGREP